MFLFRIQILRALYLCVIPILYHLFEFLNNALSNILKNQNEIWISFSPKSYKELMAKCNSLGRGKARSLRKLENVKENIVKLKVIQLFLLVFFLPSANGRLPLILLVWSVIRWLPTAECFKQVISLWSLPKITKKKS